MLRIRAKYIRVYSNAYKRLWEVLFIIWHEILIYHCHWIKALDRTLKAIMSNTHPFGGEVILFAGDFRNVLQVVPSSSSAQLCNPYVEATFFCQNVQIHRMRVDVRLQILLPQRAASEEAIPFPQFFVRLRERRVSDNASWYIDLPKYIWKVGSCKALYGYTYSDIEENKAKKKTQEQSN